MNFNISVYIDYLCELFSFSLVIKFNKRGELLYCLVKHKLHVRNKKWLNNKKKTLLYLNKYCI